jgi:hypothetical protein
MSRLIKQGEEKHRSRLIKAIKTLPEQLEPYTTSPTTRGVFNSKAKIVCGNVSISSDDLDIDFDINFDDDLEPNEAEIVIYNLSSNTISQLKYHYSLSITAGFDNDTGVIFVGYIDKVSTTYEGADKITTIRCYDDISNKTLQETTYASNTKASYILKDLLGKTGLPIAVFKARRDWTYEDEQKVDGSLYDNIKTYSEVCGVSTYVRGGKIYSRYIKDADDLYFTLSEDTGLIGSPTSFEEEITAEDYKDVVNGWECECLLQHRFAAGCSVNLKSLVANGKFRIMSGSHHFSQGEATSTIKMF